MIRFALSFSLEETLTLKATGHAGYAGGNFPESLGSRPVDLACAAFSSQIQTFALSVDSLCRKPAAVATDHKGHMERTWKGPWPGGTRLTMMVLIRSLQIGLESLAAQYPEAVNVEYHLNGLWARDQTVPAPQDGSPTGSETPEADAFNETDNTKDF